jgi:5-methylcytosine-specific restriction protein A
MPTAPPTHGQLLRKNEPSPDQFRNNQLHRRLIRSRRWEKFRAWFIGEHPLCQDCLDEGRTAPTEHVHHTRKLRDHPEDLCDDRYCRALCESHHNRRTAKGE